MLDQLAMYSGGWAVDAGDDSVRVRGLNNALAAVDPPIFKLDLSPLGRSRVYEQAWNVGGDADLAAQSFTFAAESEVGRVAVTSVTDNQVKWSQVPLDTGIEFVTGLRALVLDSSGSEAMGSAVVQLERYGDRFDIRVNVEARFPTPDTYHVVVYGTVGTINASDLRQISSTTSGIPNLYAFPAWYPSSDLGVHETPYDIAQAWLNYLADRITIQEMVYPLHQRTAANLEQLVLNARPGNVVDIDSNQRRRSVILQVRLAGGDQAYPVLHVIAAGISGAIVIPALDRPVGGLQPLSPEPEPLTLTPGPVQALLSAYSAGNGIHVSWTDPTAGSGPFGFRISRFSISVGERSWLTGLNTIVDDDPGVGSRLYRVTAYNVHGDGEPATTTAFWPAEGVLAAPTVTAVGEVVTVEYPIGLGAVAIARTPEGERTSEVEVLTNSFYGSFIDRPGDGSWEYAIRAGDEWSPWSVPVDVPAPILYPLTQLEGQAFFWQNLDVEPVGVTLSYHTATGIYFIRQRRASNQWTQEQWAPFAAGQIVVDDVAYDLPPWPPSSSAPAPPSAAVYFNAWLDIPTNSVAWASASLVV